MITDNAFAPTEVASENSFAQFNPFESATPSALKEMPSYISDNASRLSDSLTPQMRLFDTSQSEPFGITDENGQVIATADDPSNGYYTIARGGSCSAGNCSDNGDGSEYDPGDGGDGGDCGPGDGGSCDDGGCSGGGGGLLRGLLGRFGRIGLLGRLFGGGGMGFGRFLR